MFGEGYSVYKICRNLKRSQNSIRNNLIRLGLMEGEITPKRYTTRSNDVVIDDSISSLILTYTWNTFTLSFLTMVFILNPHYNILEIMLANIFIIWLGMMHDDTQNLEPNMSQDLFLDKKLTAPPLCVSGYAENIDET